MIQDALTYAQMVGYIATAVSIAGFQIKSQRKLFGMNIASDLAWVAHYALLGGFMPMISVIISALRTTLAVFIFPKHKAAIAIIACLVISTLCMIYNSDGPKGYLIIATAITYSACVFFNENYMISRSLMAIGLVQWILIGYLYGSVGEVVSSVISLVSLVAGLIRHKILSHSEA